MHTWKYHNPLQAHPIVFYVFFTHLKSKTTPVDGLQCVLSTGIVYISELNTVQPGLVRLVRLFNLKFFKKRKNMRVDAPIQSALESLWLPRHDVNTVDSR